MVEDTVYLVKAKLSTVIQFSPMDRQTRITKEDAIENAKGTMSDDFWSALEDEGWSLEFTAEKEA